MEDLKEKDKYKLIAYFCVKNKRKGIPFSVQYFKLPGLLKLTVYCVCHEVDRGEDLEWGKESGRPEKPSKSEQKRMVQS